MDRPETPSTNPIRLLDVFSGAGGLTQGWLSAATRRGAQLIAAVDADPELEELLGWNYPGANFLCRSLSDPFAEPQARSVVSALGLGEGDAEVVLAGPPCQTFSSAGKRERHADHHLVFHVCDFAELLRPNIVVIENVPEFSRAEDGRILGRLRVRFGALGYATHVFHLNALDFGVPQTRLRCFVVAICAGIDGADDPALLSALRVRTGALGLKAVLRAVGDDVTTVGDALDDLPSLASGQGDNETRLTSTPGSEYQVRLRSNDQRLYNHVAVGHSPELVAAMERLAPGETPQRIEDHPLRKKEYFRNAYARLDASQPAPTMTTQTHNPGSGRFTHYRDHRVLTVREVARLQSFPDAFRFFGSQKVQRRHVGNAVPPLLAREIAQALVPLLGG
jgi:DNA (cytosine-5)-methyltransferase 1